MTSTTDETLSRQERADLRAAALAALRRAESAEHAWSAVEELGWLAIGVPEQLGGAGYGNAERALLAEAAGRALQGQALWSGLAAGIPLAVSAGAEGAVEALLAGTRVSVAPRSAGGGAFGQALTAPPLRLTGSRAAGVLPHVPEAVVAAIVLAPAATAAGDVAIVQLDEGAWRVEEPMQSYLDPQARARTLTVDGEVHVLARGAEAERAWTDAGRCAQVWLAAESVGIAAHLLEMGVTYATEREQFGRRIGSYQAVSHQLADLYADIELARNAVDWAARSLDEAAPDATRAALAASLAADAASVSAGEKVIQVMGGLGMTWESPVNLYLKRALQIGSFDGTRRQRRERLGRLLFEPAPDGLRDAP